MPNEPTKEQLEQIQTEADSLTLPNSEASLLMYSLPLAYELMIEAADTKDGGDFRIPIGLEPGSAAIVTLIPKDHQGILMIRVQSFTSTTR